MDTNYSHCSIPFGGGSYSRFNRMNLLTPHILIRIAFVTKVTKVTNVTKVSDQFNVLVRTLMNQFIVMIQDMLSPFTKIIMP
jgi:hypothetical protein